MIDTGIVDNLIVGSGLAGIATGMALRRRGASFHVLDVGYDLDAGTEKTVAHMARVDPPAWDQQTCSRLFPPAPGSLIGLKTRLLFGSDFLYRVPDALTTRFNGCTTALSHGIGGFANVWGAAMLPYSERILRTWPPGAAELGQSYRNVLDYVSLSAERDGLQETFPLHTERATALDRSQQVDGLLRALERRKASLSSSGIAFGRARTAVNSTKADPSSCRYCGHCLDGCVYGSIFTPRLRWRDIDPDQSRLHKGFYVLEFKEDEDGVLVTAVSTQDGSLRQWRAKRLFLAAGHFATTRIIARSLGRINEPIRILDSPYFFFPFLSYRAFPRPPRFTLAEVFLEVLNQKLSEHFVHLQVYGMNGIFADTLRTLLPRPLPMSPITSRFFLFQGFVPSELAGHLELSITSSTARGDEILIRGVENPEAFTFAKRVKALLSKCLIGFGLTPPLYLQLVPPGRSFHSGGSFPMGGKHPVFSSDVLGRPAGLKRVHIVDSACFPSIASSTIGFTIMANADRISRASAELSS